MLAAGSGAVTLLSFVHLRVRESARQLWPCLPTWVISGRGWGGEG